jgi:hypothetical protein
MPWARLPNSRSAVQLALMTPWASPTVRLPTSNQNRLSYRPSFQWSLNYSLAPCSLSPLCPPPVVTKPARERRFPLQNMQANRSMLGALCTQIGWCQCLPSELLEHLLLGLLENLSVWSR